MESHTEHLWIETPRGFEQGTNSLERFIGSLSYVWRNVGSVINLAGFPLVEDRDAIASKCCFACIGVRSFHYSSFGLRPCRADAE